MRLVVVGVALVGVCLAHAPARADGIGIIACDAVGEMKPHCGFQNPEDLIALPGGKVLLVSEMGHMLEQDAKGALALFDIETETRTPLTVEWDATGPTWGEIGCERPSHLNPHGIDLGTRSDGRLVLYVVSHGGREAVEIFELIGDAGGWKAQWRGCAIPPGDPLLNDVVALPGDGFAATHMWDRGSWTVGMAFRLLFGIDTGFVWEWHPEQGFRKVVGSGGVMPNGIARSADGRFLYIDHYLEGRVVRLDRETGEVVGEVEISKPDNVTVDAEGQLWVAGHHYFIADTECDDIEGACPWKYSVTRIDPATMEGTTVVEHEGAPMGFATVALPVGDHLYLGTAEGDRIVSMPKPD